MKTVRITLDEAHGLVKIARLAFKELNEGENADAQLEGVDYFGSLLISHLSKRRKEEEGQGDELGPRLADYERMRAALQEMGDAILVPGNWRPWEPVALRTMIAAAKQYAARMPVEFAAEDLALAVEGTSFADNPRVRDALVALLQALGRRGE